MPKCVECGIEAPREEMFGTADDLRCARCGKRRQQVYRPRVVHSPHRTPNATIGLICLAVGVYLLAGLEGPGMRLLPFDQNTLHNWLAMTPEAIWDGQVWRFVTTILLDADMWHLIFNLAWIAKLGFAIEGWMGPWWFLGFVVATAVGSNALQFLFSGPAIGLSGVVFAMFGFLFALRRQKDFAAAQMDRQTVQLFFGWMIVCVLFLGGWIANWAHGAGFVFGWLMGSALLVPQRKLAVAAVTTASLLLAIPPVFTWDSEYAMVRAFRAMQRGDKATAAKWVSAAIDLEARPNRRAEVEGQAFHRADLAKARVAIERGDVIEALNLLSMITPMHRRLNRHVDDEIGAERDPRTSD